MGLIETALPSVKFALTLGHVTQRKGQIDLFGRDMSRARPHEVARLGVAYVPEGRGIFPNLNVHENLVMAARPGRDGRNDWTRDRVLETFPRLRDRLLYMGAQLSGGEQQMLSIGRALMTHPALIILDEATEGFAPQVVAEIWRVIDQIRADGIATLIVDRDYHKVLAHSDYALVLQKGEAVMSGRLPSWPAARSWPATWGCEGAARSARCGWHG